MGKRVAWNKGKKRPPFSAEWRRRMGEGHRGLKPFLGRRHSEATKKRLSVASKKMWQEKREYLLAANKKVTDLKRVIISCFICKKEFSVPRSKKQKYCSYACLGASKRKDGPKCQICNGPVSKWRNKYCRPCTRLGIWRGENNHNWKGGPNSENRTARNSENYGVWRTEVFERDNYTCVFCGTRGGRINVDHILSFSEYPLLRYDINNGRTLCYPCHKKRHRSSNRKRAIAAYKTYENKTNEQSG